MMRSSVLSRRLAPWILVVAGIVASGGVIYAVTAQAPKALDATQVKMEMLGVSYVTSLEGSDAQFQMDEEGMKKYRGAVITVKFTKPEGYSLTLSCADFPLHYWRAEQRQVWDIMPCHGVSTFSTEQTADRAMKLDASVYARQTTGTATTAAKVVYCDLFYEQIESDVSELYVLAAQRLCPPLNTDGW